MLEPPAAPIERARRRPDPAGGRWPERDPRSAGGRRAGPPVISVEEALEAVLALVNPLEAEAVPLRRAGGRVLAEPILARRDQPPFPASAMDGYAVRSEDAVPGAALRLVGEAAAGRPFEGSLAPGTAVRIFTGAPVPEGADRVVIQEDVEREGDRVLLRDGLDPGPHVRPAGGDFAAGARIEPGLRLTPERVALAAAMGCAAPVVARQPVVALMATGDELVPPGEPAGPAQVFASNTHGLAAMVEAEGAEARLLPIARDDRASLRAAFALARGADLVVTVGGASVGEHDLVAPVARELGMDLAFHKVAMRPGKPLMAGRLDGTAMLGLPGNPVSALVTGRVLLLPMIRRMLGLEPAVAIVTLPLAEPLGPNGPRRHYVRARRKGGGVAAFSRQDSSLLSILAGAEFLLVRPPRDRARERGEPVECVPLARFDTEGERS